jgi:hypothetical protein
MSPRMLYEAYRSTEGLSPAALALITYVRKNDYVTYAEMANVLAPYIPVKGNLAAEVSAVKNLVMWWGMSPEWCETLNELFTAGLLWREPCSIMCYVVDGAYLTLPLAKRPPKGGYATEHWAPSCVRPIEHIDLRERKKYAPARPRRGKAAV